MAASSKKPAADPLASLPDLPLDPSHWQAIVATLRLSPKQSQIALLVLRSAGISQIAEALKISEPTVRTHVQRIYQRVDVHDRMALAMRVLGVSHEIVESCPCRQQRRQRGG